MATFLVTGGAGFIGSHLVNHLVELGESVRVLDNFSTGKEENIKAWKDRVSIFVESICDTDIVRKAINGVDYVLHQAALPSVPRSIKDPISSNRINVNGTLNLLVESKAAGVKRFVFASSSSVYGNPTSMPVDETFLPDPRSPYAVTKLSGEYYARIYSKIYGLETVGLRYFNVFGPGQDTQSQYSAVIPIFANRILNGKNPIIFGNGDQSRDFTYIDNVVQANMLAITAKNVSGEIFSIACGQRTSLNEMVSLFKTYLNKKVKPEYVEPRPGDIKHSFANITKAKELLGYKPKVLFREGLKRTLDWYKENM